MKEKYIQGQRLWDSLMDLGNIGKDSSGGNTRLSLTKEDIDARAFLKDHMEKAGLLVRTDEMGNIIGRLEGKNPSASVVMTGSHIDTVIQGGKFDGALGVLSAIEAVRSIKENDMIPTHPIEVISFTDEEGSRFGTGYIGSKSVAGLLKEKDLDIVDADGLTYKKALIQAGFNPSRLENIKRNSDEVKGYIELHIEQGRVLESEKIPVGIVTNIQGPLWLEIELKGRADHAGATPMNLRKDPSLVMAEGLPHIEKAAIQWGGVATVGKMVLSPGLVNVIPQYAAFTIDIRHTDKQARSEMVSEIMNVLQKSADKRDVDISMKTNMDIDPVSCSDSVVKVIENACTKVGVPVFKMSCGAGHDAIPMSHITKIGMIFVCSKEGISHNPDEWSSRDDCIHGAEVLYHSLLELAE